jgi:hypothetical protein
MDEATMSIGKRLLNSTIRSLDPTHLVIANLGWGYIMNMESVVDDEVRIWKREK